MNYLLIILFIELFFPPSFYNLKFGLLIFVLALSYSNSKIKHSNYILIILLFLFISLIFKNIFALSDLFENFKWSLKISFYLLFFYRFYKINITNVNYFFILISTYILVDFYFSFYEFFRIKDSFQFNFLQSYYWGERHGLFLDRLKGINSGSGQHSTKLFLSILFISSLRILDKISKLKYILILIPSLILIYLTLSRLIIFNVFLLILFMLLFNSKKLKFFLIPFIALGIYNFIGLTSNRIIRIFKYGVNDSSMIGRFDKWSELSNFANENIIYIITGFPTRLFSDRLANSTDSEFVSVFVFFGLLGLLIYFFLIFIYFHKVFIYNKTIFILILTYFISSIFISSFIITDYAIIIFTVIISILCTNYYEKINKYYRPL